jgi:hypothetical protein
MTVVSFIDPALSGCDLGFGSTGVAVELDIDDGAGDGIDGCMKPPAPGPSAAVVVIDDGVMKRLVGYSNAPRFGDSFYECCNSEQRQAQVASFNI